MPIKRISTTIDTLELARESIFQLNLMSKDIETLLKRACDTLEVLTDKSNQVSLNASMVRKINELFVKTGERDEAIAETAAIFGVSEEATRWLYNHANKSKKALARYAKRFTAVKMVQAGYSYIEIAKVLNCHKNYVYRLIKADIPLDL